MNWVRLGAQLALLVLFLGAGTAAYKILGRPPDPEKVPEGEVPGRAVRAAKVERKDFAAPLAAYGTARAPKIHAVRPLVGGRVVAVGENFLEGRRVSQGELLFQVDAKDLEVAESEASARIREIEATLAAIDDRIAPIDSQIRRLEQELEDQKATLAILARSLELSRKEVDRLNGLFEKNAVSQEELEAGEQRLLAHEEALMVPKSRVNQIPLEVEGREAEKRSIESEREVLAARKAVAEAVLERTRLELGRTRVTSPADGIVLLADPEVRTPVKPLTSEDVLVTGQDVGWIMQSNAGVEIPVSVDFGDVI
ncbi:MAG: hypothetical protein HY720_15455, partial [Planctomycetes bacterium]|nr:hypothetical protein [Planctomycetota bacterium]